MTNKKLITSLLCAGSLACLCAAAPVFEVPRMPAPAMNETESAAWEDASSMYGFYVRATKRLENRRGRTLYGYDSNHLYLRVETAVPPGGKPLSSVRKHDGRVYLDDNVEIWLAPETGDYYYQYLVNYFGTVADFRFKRADGVSDNSWTAGWKKVSRLDEKRNLWIFEVAIPLKDLGISGNPDGKSFSMLISRTWTRPFDQTPFIRNEAPYNNFSRYAKFVLNPAAPSIQIEDVGTLHDQLFDLKGTIRNNSKVKQEYTLDLHFEHGDMPETRDTKKLAVEPGKTGTFRFQDDGGRIHLRTTHQANFTIAADGKTIYAAEYPFALPIDAENIWKLPGKTNTSFQFSIYPGLKKGAVQFEAEKNADRAEMTISLNGKNVVSREWKALKKENLFRFELPDLKSGKYQIRLTTFAGTKQLHSMSREFVRTVFPWENNQLGITDKVYAPFKPLTFNGDTLKTVLNEYTFEPSGLYADVKPRGESLFKGKSSLHFKADGKDGRIVKKDGHFTRKSGYSADFAGTVRTDSGLSIETKSLTEYDGCTRFEMTLAPEPGKTPRLDSLYLDIPLDSAQIRLFHVIKAGNIRSNPAIKVPAGEGVVWKSTDTAVSGEFYGNMHVYLWLGEMDRGLSWFAENDRNFSLDDKKPAQELIRKDGVLTLRIHFVNKPFTLNQPRTLVFGMQASPVKPMPQDWRNPKLVIPPHGGSNAYWGIRPSYAGKYPVGYDWEYVDEMVKARESGKINPKYIDSFLKKHYSDMPEDLQKNYRAHAYNGHLSMMAQRGKNPTMMYLEEHCQDQTTPEWETFQDEWGLTNFTSRKWLKEKDLINASLRSAAGLHIMPVKSYQDFVMWQCREWLKRGIGLYCDNAFPHNSTDPLNSNAYVREDGSVQPAANIWDMREYHKRMWQLTREMQEKVKWPLLVNLHITNAVFLPVVCWTDVQLDLEWGWASGYKPFPPELLEIETTGRQLGVYPQAHFPIVGCGLVHENPTYLNGKIDEDMVRTDWAMRMIYSVLRYDIRGENFTPMNKIVNDFGYGTDACNVFEYWQRDYPLSVEPAETVKSVLLRSGDRAILILASWNEQPVTVRISAKKPLKILSAQGKYPAETYHPADGAFEVKLAKYGMQLITMEVK